MEKKERTHFQEQTTPRAAQGVDFTVKGGKRQGHNVSQSFFLDIYGAQRMAPGRAISLSDPAIAVLDPVGQ
jgi:hypothetical protein